MHDTERALRMSKEGGGVVGKGFIHQCGWLDMIITLKGKEIHRAVNLAMIPVLRGKGIQRGWLVTIMMLEGKEIHQGGWLLMIVILKSKRDSPTWLAGFNNTSTTDRQPDSPVWMEEYNPLVDEWI